MGYTLVGSQIFVNMINTTKWWGGKQEIQYNNKLNKNINKY
jgi:hypothetical protein